MYMYERRLRGVYNDSFSRGTQALQSELAARFRFSAFRTERLERDAIVSGAAWDGNAFSSGMRLLNARAQRR